MELFQNVCKFPGLNINQEQKMSNTSGNSCDTVTVIHKESERWKKRRRKRGSNKLPLLFTRNWKGGREGEGRGAVTNCHCYSQGI